VSQDAVSGEEGRSVATSRACRRAAGGRKSRTARSPR
jgi:hypothetical protein